MRTHTVSCLVSLPTGPPCVRGEGAGWGGAVTYRYVTPMDRVSSMVMAGVYVSPQQALHRQDNHL